MYDVHVYIVTSCNHLQVWAGHIVAVSRLQLVLAWRPVLRASVRMALSDNFDIIRRTENK